MRQFFKFVFASCLGVVLAGGLLALIGTGILASVASSSTNPEKISANTVLHLKFEQPVPELTNNLETDPFNFKQEKVLGLQDVLYAIGKAKDDDRIKGIFIDAESAAGGFATSTAIRDQLQDFRASGKFIYAYSKSYGQNEYYLASTANKVFLNPLGMVDFRGFAAQIPFFKTMLDKVGINMQVYYVGDFKSATEPYRRTSMSPESKQQTREFLDDMYDIFLSEVSDSRGLDKSMLHQIANAYKGENATSALSSKLVDAIAYRDEVLDALRKELALKEGDKIPLVSLQTLYDNHPREKKFSAKDKVAVVYAEGGISDGKADAGQIGDEDYVKILSKIRKDDKVKALVLRVNSPGGSAMASENIWRELSLFKETGRPIIVSMGTYAASGGYYISCMADSILAEEATLTGSIGVFSLVPSVQEMLNDNIGVRFDTVKTANFATGISVVYDLSAEEGQIMQRMSESIYQTFLKRVADGRGKTMEQVHAVAQGRVWTGRKGVELGLVDRIGNLDDAIRSAVAMSGTESYRLVEYPEVKDPRVRLMEELFGGEEARQQRLIKQQLGPLYPTYQHLQQMSKSKGVQMRMPYLVPFD